MLGELISQEFFKEEIRPFYFTRREGGNTYNGSCSYALRFGDWKLIRNKPGSQMELFNLKSDPYEKLNVINQNAKIYADLNKSLMQHIQKAGKIPWQKP
jgi:arylsulfatase A-like enzyme